MAKRQKLNEALGLVKYSMRCSKKDSNEATKALSHCLNVEEDTISVESGYVWTEVGFDTEEEADSFSTAARISLRNYTMFFFRTASSFMMRNLK